MASYNGWEPNKQQQHQNSELIPRPLGIFWDIENCSVPSGKSALAVCEKIRKQDFFRGHREIQFAVVCDANKESKNVLEELDKAQVDIVHIAATRKNAADDKLKQIMRRFADIHREGSRIILISGDVDFAADIADFKRRMCLSVILLHNSNASESLILAASEVHNFYDILSTLPVKHDNIITRINDELTVSNLPSIKDCPEQTILQKLNQAAKEYGGKVIKLYGSHGSAILKFCSADQAKSFKSQYLHYKIKDRPINIHYYYGKSPLSSNTGGLVSQSAGPASKTRTRTISDSGKKGQTSSEEYHPQRFSSQESLSSDGNVDQTQQNQSSKLLDISNSLSKLSMSKKKEQRYSSESSSTEEMPKNERLSMKTNSNIRSKLKLKNRKNSEATQQVQNPMEMTKQSKEDDSSMECASSARLDNKDHSNSQLVKLKQISTNLTLLVDTQLRTSLDSAVQLYKERHQADLISSLAENEIQSLPNFIQSYCNDLTIIHFNTVPHIVIRNGEFVKNNLKQINDVLYQLQKGNANCPIPVSVFENEYGKAHCIAELFDLDFVTRECKGIRKTSRAFNREFVELTLTFMLGNEIEEVVKKKGGIIPISNIIGYYKASTGKNLDSTYFGFDNLENLLKELDLFVKITGNKKSIALRSVHNQISQKMNQTRQHADRKLKSENTRADEYEGAGGAASNLHPHSHSHIHSMIPDVIVETIDEQESRLRTAERTEAGENNQASPVLTYLSQDQTVKSRKLKLTSFVTAKTEIWQGYKEGDKSCMERRHEQDTAPSEGASVERNAEAEYNTNTPGDIITIEDSVSEAESVAADSNCDIQSRMSNSSNRGRRKSRLAAKFSGN